MVCMPARLCLVSALLIATAGSSAAGEQPTTTAGTAITPAITRAIASGLYRVQKANLIPQLRKAGEAQVLDLGEPIRLAICGDKAIIVGPLLVNDKLHEWPILRESVIGGCPSVGDNVRCSLAFVDKGISIAMKCHTGTEDVECQEEGGARAYSFTRRRGAGRESPTRPAGPEETKRSGSASDDLNTQGFRLYKQKKYVEAADLFKQALAADPRHALAHYNLACTLALISKTDEACKLGARRSVILEHLARAVELDGTRPSVPT